MGTLHVKNSASPVKVSMGLPLMLLDQWLFLSRTSNAEFAALVGVSKTTVRRWRDGTDTPGEQHWPAIERAVAVRTCDMVIALALPYGRDAILPNQ